jgi:thioesterase domain-containing protein
MTSNTAALFARSSRNSGQVILPINDIARSEVPAKQAFYCVHSVSGVAGSDFLPLAHRLDPAVRFFGIQAPLSQMREPDFGGSIESIAAYYTDALMRFQPEGPLHLGGYCVGGLIALEMARFLADAGRSVGPLVVIDGVPENTGGSSGLWRPSYWLDVIRNLPGWIDHADLMRSKSFRSLLTSLANNASAVGWGVLGLRRGEKLRGGYAMDSMMDLSIYPPDHRLFINRLFAALNSYVPKSYAGDIVVYEAKTAPLLYSPQIGRTWSRFAPQSQIVKIIGTHIGMIREPYVEVLANDLAKRIEAWRGP